MTTSEVSWTTMDTPVGKTAVAWREEGLVAIRFGAAPSPGWRHLPRADNEALRQLRAYFAGELRAFDVPLAVQGTPFQHSVWGAVSAIPFGETRSYAEIAAAVGRPRAVRAVGAANGRNDVPIVIPCHRVIASDGSLHGYAGGLAIKAALLAFEREGVWPASLGLC